MKRFINPTLGVAFIIAAVGGIIFSLAGIGGTWYFKPHLEETLTGYLTLLDDTLQTTSDGLLVAHRSLGQSIDSMAALQQTIGATADTLDATTPLLDTLADLSEEDLPRTLETAQTSLRSAQTSAQIIDRVLAALSILPGIDYDPEVPLGEALQQVSASLDSIFPSLESMHTSLENTTSNMEIIQADIDLIAIDVANIQSSLEDGRGVVEQYQELVTDLDRRVDQARNSIPSQITIAAWVLTFALLWAFFTQLGLLVQGFTLINGRREP